MHRLRHDAMPMLATVESAQREMATAGVIGSVARRLVRVPDLDAGALVDWRLGMVDMAPFVTTLDQRRRTALREHCLELLGPEHPPLIRSIIVIRLNA